MKIIVASKNPVKIEAVKQGYEAMFQEPATFHGVSVPSHVSDQPMSDEETLQGAINRAQNAKKEAPDADCWVGIEGGLEQGCVFAWVVVIGKKEGRARTASFSLPPKVLKLIDEGKELGDASDEVFDEHNSKQKNGSIGILTDDAITRTSYYKEAVVLAFIPLKNEALYHNP